MEVDLLRPGTVPISPDTVLGFEFLLDRDLLLRHLQKPSADPSPTDLITKFYDVVAFTLHLKLGAENSETINIDPIDTMKIKHPAKNIAMKILALKVAAYLKWNLAKIRSLPFKTQINLLQDLMYFTSEDRTVMEIPNIENADTKSASPQFLFALLLFHSLHDMSLNDETIICCPENIQKTITFLQDALNWSRKDVPFFPTIECFHMPTEQNDSIEFEWNKAQSVSREEFCAQISYDLGTFFFYRENYEEAKCHFTQCYQHFNNIKTFSGFTDIDKTTLEVYCRACDPTVDVQKRSLLEQLNNSIVNQYVGITNILQQDNLVREIPLIHRINLELDIQGAVSSCVFTVARDLLHKVKALNHIRCALERSLFLSEFSLDNTSKNVDALLWAIQVNWKSHTISEQKVIKDYLFELVIKNENSDLLQKIQSNDVLANVFDKRDLQYISEKGLSSKSSKVPGGLFMNEFSFFETPKKRIPSVEVKLLEQKLLTSYDSMVIKEVLTKMSAFNRSSNIWDINPLWELAIPLQSVINSLPRGLLQDYAFVLLAKSKEQLLNKNWLQSITLLIVLNKEIEALKESAVAKLQKMVNWEVILVQITQILEDWPKTLVDKEAFADACEVCIQTNGNDSVVPRTEIFEACGICLLNFGRWEFLTKYDKRWSTFSFETISALALACHEAAKTKGGKKFSKNLWEIVLAAFSPNGTSQQKRGTFPDSSNCKSELMSVFLRLKDHWCLTVVISLLTKLFNVLKDEPNLELQVDYNGLWPSTISNASSYDAEAVLEALTEVLTQALKDYPTNIPWLRLMGDINFANSNYKISIAYYLKSLLICSDYFNIPVRNDDHVFRRMIKSCQSLGCYTQAAVLCQFLEEPDYTLAFRILSEQKTCNDAVDAYYHCFWDTTLLEYLIYIHNRRGEFQRRKTAIQVMGMLELNSNNNEEIQREASNLRKSVFLRALCKQLLNLSGAAVTCQFLEEPDYTLALRILTEQKTCNDAVDAYYHCFWDTTLSEYLVYIHNRRGEFQKRKTVIHSNNKKKFKERPAI